MPKEWGVEPHLRVSNLTREHLRKVITAFIATGDGDHAAPYYRQGTGTINMLVLAMRSQIAEGKQNVIFSMEEPETAIPPYAQKRIVHEVRKLASQALFSSHSPYVLEEFAVDETVVLMRDADGVLVRKTITLPDNVKPKRYRQEFRTRFCEGLLSRRVLIAEGATEASAFPVACRRLAELNPASYASLEALGMCTVDAGSDTNIPGMAQLYRELGKRTFALCDKQGDGNKAMIEAQTELTLMHDEGGFENLVLKGTSEEALQRFAESFDWPKHLLQKYPDPALQLADSLKDALRNPPAGMTEVHHVATLDMEAAILGAEVIALLLQPAIGDLHLEQFVELVCNFFRGKGGDEPTRGALKEAEGIRKAHAEFAACRIAGKPLSQEQHFRESLLRLHHTRALVLTGIPDDDWRGMRRVLQEGACVRLQQVAEEVRNVRVVDRGTYLRQALTQDWRDHGEYRNALAITRQAFMQEHFSTTAKPETGVVVMNMHKAKGKQFDEVIIFEGWPTTVKGAPPHNPDRIVRFNSKDEVNDQARQTFRVSATRAKRRTTILTPQGDPCILLGT